MGAFAGSTCVAGDPADGLPVVSAAVGKAPGRLVVAVADSQTQVSALIEHQRSTLDFGDDFWLSPTTLGNRFPENDFLDYWEFLNWLQFGTWRIARVCPPRRCLVC